MPLATGTRLGPYVVEAGIGAGGMGEVYRARDSKLNRQVALKVLPELFTADDERLTRFRREAQVLASLNHPNIAQIHGFEDSGNTHALVLEPDRHAAAPLAVLASFLGMYWAGITSNIMSLAGIAIALGVLVDAGIVVTENAFRFVERRGSTRATAPP